jgi:peptide/nickel transport system substrate-binding protein
VLGAVSQEDMMTAVAGTDRSLWRDGVGVFTPGSLMASDEGMEVLTGPRDLAASRHALEAAGYRGEKVVLIAPTDFPAIDAMSEVTGDLFRRLGMNLDYVATDWGSALRRQANREPPERGGYSALHLHGRCEPVQPGGTQLHPREWPDGYLRLVNQPTA